MCGIVGAVTFDGAPGRVTAEYLQRMRDTMVHRGPDGAGLWIDPRGRVGLGHRRLSIIDLSAAAAQPMCNEDGTLWLTYNGELYNHREIRRELRQRGGHQWKTDHSDTEVVLHAFEEWGIDCVRRFRGMFAFGLWDQRRDELWLVRDRIGIKPLYYSIHHGRLTFASEIKALLADPEQRRAVNEEAVFHYLSFLAAPAPSTLFEGIMKVEAGTYLRVQSGGQVTRRRYWDAWEHTQPLVGVSEGEIVERLRAELRTAVSIHKESDVPVGIALSGGVDSTLNTALFSEGENTAVNTFTVGYDDEYPSAENELEEARQAARLYGTTHHEQRLTVDDLRGSLAELVRLQDEPIGDPVCLPVYYLARQVRQNGVIVCQFGEGADELFCGYDTWNLRIRLQEADNLPVPRLLKRGGLSLLESAKQGEGFPYEYLRRGSLGQPIFWSGAESFTDAMKRSLLSPRLKRQFASLTSWDAIAHTRKRFEENAWEKSTLNWMTYADLNLRHPELLLMRVDKMGMGSSVEGRVPFLDHKVVELALSIPTAVKTRNRELKYILKKAARGIIPDEVIDRRKKGFAVPLVEWLAGDLGADMARELKDFCRESEILDWPGVERVLHDPKWQSPAWILLNLAVWWKQTIREAGDVAVPA